ncbi:MAG TPA: DUF1702 family protein [Streptosporangiaceae bacterium]|jgi:hypothetical protein|nr:DUF1702 family protein [Streptosporangiaceae bacterium]
MAAERAGSGRRITSFLRRDERQVDFGVRRFRLSTGSQREILETASRAFLTGFNATVSASAPADLAARLEELGEHQRGHALEGAGMAAAMLDALTLRRGRRLRALLSGPGRGYPQLVLSGAGRGYASLHRRPSRLVRSLPADRVTNPALRWFAWDGYGFHRGFFTSDETIGGQRQPRRLTAEQRSLFDQGVGRSLWFHECADPDGVALRIAEFAQARRADLWCGAGLAATYTGGADVADLGRLAVLAGQYRPDLACGAALACAARTHAGLTPAHTGAAAHALTGALAEEASGWVATALRGLGLKAASPGGYLLWREQISDLWTAYRGPAELTSYASGEMLAAGRGQDRFGSSSVARGQDAFGASVAGLESLDAASEFASYVPAQTAAPVSPATARAAERER